MAKLEGYKKLKEKYENSLKGINNKIETKSNELDVFYAECDILNFLKEENGYYRNLYDSINDNDEKKLKTEIEALETERLYIQKIIDMIESKLQELNS